MCFKTPMDRWMDGWLVGWLVGWILITFYAGRQAGTFLLQFKFIKWGETEIKNENKNKKKKWKKNMEKQNYPSAALLSVTNWAFIVEPHIVLC